VVVLPNAARDGRQFLSSPGKAHGCREPVAAREGCRPQQGRSRAGRPETDARAIPPHHLRPALPALESRSHMIVSIVTRSVDGEEQFSSTYRARVNRVAGHPGHGIELRPNVSQHRLRNL